MNEPFSFSLTIRFSLWSILTVTNKHPATQLCEIIMKPDFGPNTLEISILTIEFFFSCGAAAQRGPWSPHF